VVVYGHCVALGCWRWPFTLINERKETQAARDRSLDVAGTLGILRAPRGRV
jgi:hypothetical protein